MKVVASIIKVCSANVKLLFRTKFSSKFFSSLQLALENEVSLPRNNSYIPIINQHISSTYNPCHNLDMNRIDQFRIMEETFFSYEYTHEVKDEQLSQIRVILESHGWNLGSPDNYQRINLNQYNVVKILYVLYEENKDPSLALYFFKWCENHIRLKHSIQSICTMINILISGKMNHRAVDLIQYLVQKNYKQNWWLSLSNTRFSRPIVQTAYSMLVDCYIKENKSVTAYELTSQLKGFDFFPSLGVCCSLLQGLLQSDQIELARDFFKEIYNRGLGCNISFISLFIHKYCSVGDLKSGWKLLTEIKNYGINPDLVTYTIFINSLSKMSRLRDATCLLFKLGISGMILDSVSVTSVINGYCKIGKMEKGINLMKIFNISLDIFVYNSFLSKLCNNGDMILACEVFQEMLNLGFVPDCFCYTTMIKGFCGINKLNLGFSFLAKMLKKGFNPSCNTYTILIDYYCKHEDLVTGEKLLRKMEMEGLVPDLVLYNILMDGYGKKGFTHKAFQVLDKMKSRGVFPDNVSYNILIHSLVIRGFIEEAKELINEVIKRGFKPDIIAYTNLISGYAKKGNFEEVYMVWVYMSENDMKPDVVMCSALLNGYCKARRMIEANELFVKMLEMGLIPDKLLYNTLIHGFCSLGEIDSACSLIDMMIKNGFDPDEITHKALILGFEKKWIQNPVQAATHKLQEMILKSGFQEL